MFTNSTHIYTLSLHDALPISVQVEIEGVQSERAHLVAAGSGRGQETGPADAEVVVFEIGARRADRKSTRLNSSHVSISYAVFCLKKKTNILFVEQHRNQIVIK